MEPPSYEVVVKPGAVGGRKTIRFGEADRRVRLPHGDNFNTPDVNCLPQGYNVSISLVVATGS
jgi:hypothetical protein